MNTDLSFGEWLEDQYRERGWSQGGFAARLGLAQSTVSSWVNGVQSPSRKNQKVIARELGIDVDEVFRRTGNASVEPPTRLRFCDHIGVTQQRGQHHRTSALL